jgi:hypothetical protein
VQEQIRRWLAIDDVFGTEDAAFKAIIKADKSQ